MYVCQTAPGGVHHRLGLLCLKGMKIVRNRIIPFPGYKAMNLFGILFVRGDAKVDDVTINHESIHTAQMKELLYVFFYLWYVIEWLVRLFMKGNAYRNICFEREAYGHQKDLCYLEKRKHYCWFKLIRHA